MFSKSTSSCRVAVSNQPVDERRTLRNLVLAVGAFTCLTLGSLGIAGSAEARVPASASGPEAEACRAIQSDYDELTGLLKRPGLTPQQRAHYQSALDKITRRWEQECSQFGSIQVRRLPNVASLENAGAVQESGPGVGGNETETIGGAKTMQAFFTE